MKYGGFWCGGRGSLPDHFSSYMAIFEISKNHVGTLTRLFSGPKRVICAKSKTTGIRINCSIVSVLPVGERWNWYFSRWPTSSWRLRKHPEILYNSFFIYYNYNFLLFFFFFTQVSVKSEFFTVGDTNAVHLTCQYVMNFPFNGIAERKKYKIQNTKSNKRHKLALF